MNHSIVFIHGSGDSAYIWRLQIEHFGTDRAFAIDLPGHGQRANTLPDEVGVLDYARSVLAIITGELHLDHPDFIQIRSGWKDRLAVLKNLPDTWKPA